MGLKDYRDEVGEFLEKIGSKNEPLEKDIERLEEEFEVLKQSLNSDSDLRHQIYDMLFILFSIAAKKDLDLEEEWEKGREKKKKYTEK